MTWVVRILLAARVWTVASTVAALVNGAFTNDLTRLLCDGLLLFRRNGPCCCGLAVLSNFVVVSRKLSGLVECKVRCRVPTSGRLEFELILLCVGCG